MRTFIGMILILLIVTGATLTVLALWGIQPISWAMVWRSGATIIIIGIVLLLVSLIRMLFFGKLFGDKNKQ